MQMPAVWDKKWCLSCYLQNGCVERSKQQSIKEYWNICAFSLYYMYSKHDKPNKISTNSIKTVWHQEGIKQNLPGNITWESCLRSFKIFKYNSINVLLKLRKFCCVISLLATKVETFEGSNLIYFWNVRLIVWRSALD